MNIAVYCGSSSGNDETFAQKARELGNWMGKNGHRLIFGGSNTGLMGAVSDAALEAGGSVTGVVPDVELIKARMHRGLTEYIFTKDMKERKATMIDLAEAFIALPGGPGTLDEISEVISYIQLKLISGKVVFVDVNNYYKPLKEFLLNMRKSGFNNPEQYGEILFSDNIEEIGRFLAKKSD